MEFPVRHILFGTIIGVALSVVFSVTGPGPVLNVFADEQPAGFDTSRLVKFGDHHYDVRYDDWVDTRPSSTATVRKIEAGKVTNVTITTTSTGVYSSDAIVSPHVKYPGIEVTQVADAKNNVAFWTRGRWVPFTALKNNSFIALKTGGVALLSGAGVTCVASRSYAFC